MKLSYDLSVDYEKVIEKMQDNQFSMAWLAQVLYAGIPTDSQQGNPRLDFELYPVNPDNCEVSDDGKMISEAESLPLLERSVAKMNRRFATAYELYAFAEIFNEVLSYDIGIVALGSAIYNTPDDKVEECGWYGLQLKVFQGGLKDWWVVRLPIGRGVRSLRGKMFVLIVKL